MSNVLFSPKTDTYHFRINPEVRTEVEEIYAKSGITLTQAINIFLQQTISVGGFPFQISGDNAEYINLKQWLVLPRNLRQEKIPGTW